MAGYSGTPLVKKLGIGEADTVAFRAAPEGFGATLGELPDSVQVKARVRGPVDVVVAFFTGRAELDRRLDALGRAVYPDGSLWIAWPKRSSAIPTELDFSTVQGSGLESGLVDNKSCSIDEQWQALRFVRRLRDRPGMQAGQR
ncbi:MAG: DUF3052 domain-containing protein [Nitriliruptorales bacterium]